MAPKLDNTLINEESLWNSVLPRAYFSSIALEFNSDVEVPSYDNPHIINELHEPTSKTTKQLLEEINSAKLRVTIDVVIKEKITDFLTKTWFENETLRNTVRIQLWRATTPEAATWLRSATYGDLKGTINEGANAMGVELLSTRALGEYITDYTSDPGAVKDQVQNYYKTINSDGTEAYDLTYRFVDSLDNSEPPYLSYYAVVTIDYDALIAAFDLAANIMTVDINIPHQKTWEHVYINGSVVTTADIFQLADTGEIYMGPVHQMVDGSYMAGTHHDPAGNQKYLKKTTVANSTIKDYRNFSYLEKLNIDFSILESEMVPKVTSVKFVEDQRVKPAKNPAYFMDALLTRDKTGRCRFLFGVNYERIMLENSMFPKYFSPGAVNFKTRMGDLLSRSRILNFKVTRRRVKEEPNIIGTRVNTPTLSLTFDPDNHGAPQEPEEIIINAGRSQFSMTGQQTKDWYNEFKTITGTNQLGETTETTQKVGSIRNIGVVLEDVDAESSRFKFYTGVDHNVATVTDGHYQYAVEMTIYDATPEIFRDQIIKARNAVETMQQYLNYAESKHEFFDPVSNRFTQAFIDMYASHDIQDRLYWKALTDWLDVLAFLTNNYDPSFIGMSGTKQYLSLKLLNLKESLLIFCSPEAGNLKGIRETIRVMEKIVYNISKQLGEFIELNPGFKPPTELVPTTMPTHKADNTLRKNTFKIKVYHQETFDSDTAKNIGYDYLSTNFGDVVPETNIGLKKLSLTEYRERTMKEINKFISSPDKFQTAVEDASFQIPTGDSLETTRYSYLGLSQAFIGDDDESTPFPYGDQQAHAPDLTEDYSFVDQLPIEAYSVTELKDSEFTTFASIPRKLLTNVIRHHIKSENLDTRTLQSLELEMQKIYPGLIETDLSRKVHQQEKNALKRLLASKNCTVEAPAPPGPGSIDFKILVYENFEFQDWMGTILADPIMTIPDGDGADPGAPDVTPNYDVLENTSDTLAVESRTFSKLFRTLAIYKNIKDFHLETIGRYDYGSSLFGYKDFTGVEYLPGVPSLFPDGIALVEALPNHIKFLLYNLNNLVSGHSQTARDLTINPVSFALLYFLVENLMVVEFLSGFESSKDDIFGKKQIQAPVWRKLDLETFASFSDAERSVSSVVCRLRPYKNSHLNIKQKPEYTLPLYNEFFIIDFGGRSTAATPPPREDTRNRGVDTREIVPSWEIQTSPRDYGQERAEERFTGGRVDTGPLNADTPQLRRDIPRGPFPEPPAPEVVANNVPRNISSNQNISQPRGLNNQFEQQSFANTIPRDSENY